MKDGNPTFWQPRTWSISLNGSRLELDRNPSFWQYPASPRQAGRQRNIRMIYVYSGSRVIVHHSAAASAGTLSALLLLLLLLLLLFLLPFYSLATAQQKKTLVIPSPAAGPHLLFLASTVSRD
jgi:Flp pilus assembly protein TadB